MNNANTSTGKSKGYFIKSNQWPNSRYIRRNRNHRKHQKPKQQESELDEFPDKEFKTMIWSMFK